MIPENIQDGDLLSVKLSNGQQLFLEVVVLSGKRKGKRLLCNGELLRIQEANTLSSDGFLPRISELWVKKIPDLVKSLNEIRSAQKNGHATLPSSVLKNEDILEIIKVTSFQDLLEQVESHPSPWCDGAGPTDPPPSELDNALLTSGEILAVLLEKRPMCLLQTALPIDIGGDRLPLLRPFVMRALKKAAESKSILITSSTAPGARSLILGWKKNPYKAWSAYLAEVGVQASLVAGSDFYKYIIGKMMGYKEENIQHHIESSGGSISASLLQAVNNELDGLA